MKKIIILFSVFIVLTAFRCPKNNEDNFKVVKNESEPTKTIILKLSDINKDKLKQTLIEVKNILDKRLSEYYFEKYLIEIKNNKIVVILPEITDVLIEKNLKLLLTNSINMRFQIVNDELTEYVNTKIIDEKGKQLSLSLDQIQKDIFKKDCHVTVLNSKLIKNNKYRYYVVNNEPFLDINDISSAKYTKQYGNMDNINITFSENGKKKLHEITKNSIGKRLAIIFDGLVIVEPIIREEIKEGKVSLTGLFSEIDCFFIASMLNGGYLKYKVEIEN